jgi:hypothetical protein
MAVNDPDVVDLVSIDPSGCVVLTISDHLDWLDSISHQQVLQEKINRYLAFVESGEILESYPHAKGRQVIVRVVAKYQPDPAGLQFFDRAKGILAQAGIQFLWNQFQPVRQN